MLVIYTLACLKPSQPVLVTCRAASVGLCYLQQIILALPHSHTKPWQHAFNTCNCRGKSHNYGSLIKLQEHYLTAIHKKQNPFTGQKASFSCCVEGCIYTTSNAFNFHRHQVVCEQKAQNALTGQNSIKGTRTFSHGVYVGDIVDNKMHGHGMFTFNCGQIHKGTFEKGECTGPGIRSYPDGDVYEGDIFDYMKHGQGTYTWSNGDKYIGSYAKDECHGQGTNIFASGERYEGSFANNKWNGKGINTWSNGDKYEGTFVNNKLI
jgi:hypothetical protein